MHIPWDGEFEKDLHKYLTSENKGSKLRNPTKTEIKAVFNYYFQY